MLKENLYLPLPIVYIMSTKAVFNKLYMPGFFSSTETSINWNEKRTFIVVETFS